MKACSTNRIKHFSDVYSFYSDKAQALTDGPYIESKLQSDFFNSELENWSEVSLDTSSNGSQRYRAQANQNYIPMELGDAGLMYGSSDGGTLSPLELPEAPKSLRYSDDEISEIWPHEQTGLHSTNTIGKQEELRYLQELVHSANLYDEYESGTSQDLFCNMDVSQEAGADFLLADNLMWDMLCEEESLRLAILNEHQTNLRRMMQQSANEQPCVTSSIQTKRKCSDLQLRGYKQHAYKSKMKSQQPPPSRSTFATNKKNETKPDSGDGEKRVFLGGLPVGMTERSLRHHLALLGYKVLKRPKILRGFAPEVLMRSAQEARRLVARGNITINGCVVEVRPFNSLMKQSESSKIPNINKRSIFLGGLTDGTTTKDIQDAFIKMGIRILNYPVVKFGVSRQVILETVHQAKTLIEKKKVLINGTLADVRPFVRHQRRKKSHKKNHL